MQNAKFSPITRKMCDDAFQQDCLACQVEINAENVKYCCTCILFPSSSFSLSLPVSLSHIFPLFRSVVFSVSPSPRLSADWRTSVLVSRIVSHVNHILNHDSSSMFSELRKSQIPSRRCCRFLISLYWPRGYRHILLQIGPHCLVVERTRSESNRYGDSARRDYFKASQRLLQGYEADCRCEHGSFEVSETVS